MINKKNEHGNRDGEWEHRFSGQLISKGKYLNGIREGFWEMYFFQLKTISHKGTYSNGNREGLWIFYENNESLFKKIYYV